MKSRARMVVVALALLTAGLVRAESNGDKWSDFRFLVGEWVGEGEGGPGKGSGGFTLTPDLGGKILVRSNHAEYPAAGGRPAVVHDDLMVIHPSKNGRGARADYWDNEGHVIRYAVTPSGDGKGLVFLSDAATGEPRFRLSYAEVERGLVTIKFEIAPPGKPEAFKAYLEAKVRRK